MKNREIRNFTVDLRAVDNEDHKPMITGQAAVYNSRSVDLGGFTEIIEPGFFENVMEGDTRALFNHDPNYLLGRTVSETLRLIDYDGGLGFQADPPETQTIHDLVMVPMQRGDLNQCSFAFTVARGGDEWKELPDGSWERRLKRGGCESLYDISVVTYPAYEETSAEARARFEAVKEGGFPLESCGNDSLEEAAGDPDPVIHDPADNSEEKSAPVGDSLRKRKFEVLKAQVKR